MSCNTVWIKTRPSLLPSLLDKLHKIFSNSLISTLLHGIRGIYFYFGKKKMLLVEISKYKKKSIYLLRFIYTRHFSLLVIALLYANVPITFSTLTIEEKQLAQRRKNSGSLDNGEKLLGTVTPSAPAPDKNGKSSLLRHF